jgi:hypothetical protein
MADGADGSEQQTGVGVAEGVGRKDTRGAAVTPGRRAYAAPRLRYLGKVADVTFGTGGSHADGGHGGGFKHG